MKTWPRPLASDDPVAVRHADRPVRVVQFHADRAGGLSALALANGPLGIMLLLRRMALNGNVLSHAVMPGAALGFVYAGHSLSALSAGGLTSGALVAGLTGLLGRDRAVRHEAGLIAFYLVALALGGYPGGILRQQRRYRAGAVRTVLAIDKPALLQIATVCTLTVLLLAVFYRSMTVDAFDPVFLRMVGGHGMRGLFVILLLLNLVVSFQAFGTLLAIGPMLLPAAAARCWTYRPGAMFVLASAFGMLGVIRGFAAVVSSQSAVGASHRHGGGRAVRHFAGSDDRRKPHKNRRPGKQSMNRLARIATLAVAVTLVQAHSPPRTKSKS